jgi:hypothetical protein
MRAPAASHLPIVHSPLPTTWPTGRLLATCALVVVVGKLTRRRSSYVASILPVLRSIDKHLQYQPGMVPYQVQYLY